MSTHFSGDEDEHVDGQEFGTSTLDLAPLAVVDSRGLPGAGFTDGGGRPASWSVRAAIAGEQALVAHGGGLEILRIGPDLTLERRAHLDLPIAAVDVAVDGDEALVVGVPASLVRVDVADPQAPRIVESTSLGGGARPSPPPSPWPAGGPTWRLRHESSHRWSRSIRALAGMRASAGSSGPRDLGGHIQRTDPGPAQHGPTEQALQPGPAR